MMTPAENKALCRSWMPAAVTMDGIPVLVLFALKNRDAGSCLWGRGSRAGPRGICSGCVTVGQCVGMNQTQESLGKGLLFKNLLTQNQAVFPLEWAE